MNPLMLHELVALGYDRSHESLALVESDSLVGDVAGQRPAASSVAQVEIEGGRVRLPAGVAFDPGGIGKGLAADIVMEDLLAAGASWALVSLGGDLRFGGDELKARGWNIQIEQPGQHGHVWGTVELHGGALATSSTLSRRWTHGQQTHHHLLDPATGRPAAGSRLAATVHANEAWWADVVAKVLVIDDDIGQRQLDSWGATALIFDEGGTTNFGLGAFELQPLAPT